MELFVIRLMCAMRDKRMVLEKRGRSEIEFVKGDESSVVRGTVMDWSDNGE